MKVMKKINRYLNERKNDIIYTGSRAWKMVIGSGMCKQFDKKENEDILDVIDDKNNDKLLYFLLSVDEEKYSDTIVIKMDGLLFSLYARGGRLRIGAGGNKLTSCKFIKDVSAKNIIKLLKKNVKIK